MLANLSGWHLLIILAVVLLLFGASRLPALSKGIGQSIRIFKGEMRESDAAKTPQAESTKTTVGGAPSTEAASENSSRPSDTIAGR
jgi:sec-independent protein translocase protein TatA